MIEVIEINKTVNDRRIAALVIRYYHMMIKCDLCLYKEKNLWVRMPEMWIKNGIKYQFMYWPVKEISDAFQAEVIRQVQEKTGLTLEKAIEIKRKLMDAKKKDRARKASKKKDVDLNKK